jgi:transposase
LTAIDERWVVRMVTKGKIDNAAQAARQLTDITNKDFSVRTARRVLKRAGLKPRNKKKKPRLLARHIRQRRAFGKKYRHWTAEDWRRVVFSDETKVNLVGSGGCQVRWMRDGSALTEHDVQGTVKFGGGGLMMWGCITSQGVGHPCRIIGNMDAHLYTEILNNEFLQTLEYYGLEKEEIVFQQDNDSKHTSRPACQWFRDKRVEVLEWPSQSPDLNPIEHLWAHLKQRLAKAKPAPTNIDELWWRAQEEWMNIPKQTCINLIESMPGRIAAMLRAKGGYTKY